MILRIKKLFPKNSVSYLYMSHFLEHVSDLGAYINEFSRVISSGGRLEIVVPHFSNPYYYSDSTHKTFFGLYTLSAFAQDNIHSRKVPTYDNTIYFYLKRADLVFKSTKPAYFFLSIFTQDEIKNYSIPWPSKTPGSHTWIKRSVIKRHYKTLRRL